MTLSIPWAARPFYAVLTLLLVLTMLGRAPAEELEEIPWSFQLPVRPDVPPSDPLTQGGRVTNPIDSFVFARLDKHELLAAPLAERHVLVRRAYFDLLGLPPSPAEVQAFVNSEDPDAWPKLIDRLLQSKHYGERWGRHWLDVARYADSGGYETDIYYRHAWRYRDYVVRCFNNDKPYDRFLQEQIAGDELWPDNLDLDPKRVYLLSDAKKEHMEARIGTGFYTLGPLVHESALDATRLRHESLTDWVDTTASAFLGLTLACARCHEHKFDPLSQADYYNMQAVFANSKQVEVPLLTAMEVNDWRQSYPRIVAVDEARTAYKLFQARTAGRNLTDDESRQKTALLVAIAEAVLQLPERAGSVPHSPFESLMGVPSISALGHERQELLPTVYRLERGELSKPAEKARPAIPRVLAQVTSAQAFLTRPLQQRKDLALWLTSADHPLTARVMVNRIWQWHFGQGIVATPNDFGAMGSAPTHPQLLDWLATEFVARKWSIKQMHRLIMQSTTYRLASGFASEKHLQIDPANKLLWRMNRRRLEAEAIWDSVHALAGTLNLEMGGRPVVPPLAEDEIAALRERWHWPVSADPRQHTRRGMYILVRRNFPFPMFEVFDAPVTSSSCPQRDITTVAPQALWSLNSPSVFEQAKHFAARASRDAGNEHPAWLSHVWLTAFARPPSERELHAGLALLDQLRREAATSKDLATALGELPAPLPELELAEATSRIHFCLAIYNLNEFSFVD